MRKALDDPFQFTDSKMNNIPHFNISEIGMCFTNDRILQLTWLLHLLAATALEEAELGTSAPSHPSSNMIHIPNLSFNNSFCFKYKKEILG